MWKGGRSALDTAPTLYLPMVAGNFTSAAALGAWSMPIGDGYSWVQEFSRGWHWNPL